MKKLLFLVCFMQIAMVAFAGKPVLKSEMCGKVSNEQFIIALEKGDPDGIFNQPVKEIIDEYKRVFNWAILYYAWGFDPIVTDTELFAAMRVCSIEPAVFSEGSRLISYVENGEMKYDDFRGNYEGENAGTFRGKLLWSDWCKNLLPEKDFLNPSMPSTGVTKKETVVASAGQPINIYVYAGNNNGNNNGGDALALNTAPAAENAVDASAPAPAVYQPPAPRYDPPQVVYQQQQPVVYQTGPVPSSGGDCPECKKGVPAWVPVATAAGGVVVGYLLNKWLGNGSSGGTYYGGQTGSPVEVNGGNPIGPGGPVDIPGGPVEINGGN